VVNFFETFSTHYFNSPKQDSTIKFLKKLFKYQLMQFVLKVVILECSFLNHSQGILGVNTFETKFDVKIIETKIVQFLCFHHEDKCMG
jgi:hypothetical protein